MENLLLILKSYWWLVVGCAAFIKFIFEIVQFLEFRRENKSLQAYRAFVKKASIIGFVLLTYDILKPEQKTTSSQE